MTAKPRFSVHVRDVPVGLIDLDPDNERQHPDENRAGIHDSLEQYGLQKPIVIVPQESGRFRCVAGNGTLTEAIRLGAETIAACISDLRGDDVDGYRVADNATAETATWDFGRLRATLDKLRARGFPMAATGWSAPRLAQLAAPDFKPATPEPKGAASAPSAVEAAPTPAPSDEKLEGGFVHWRTSPDTLLLVRRCCGLAEFDLDVASNENSVVPARVSLQGGDEALPVKACLSGQALPGGRERPKACGLRSRWPSKAAVWWNPPYNDIGPWLLQVLWHAGAGGCGAGIVPANFEVSWGQAILLARTDLVGAMQQLARSLDEKKMCAARDAIRDGKAVRRPDAPWTPLMVRGRVAFLDARRGTDDPVANNRDGSVLVFWGHDNLDRSVQPERGVWL